MATLGSTGKSDPRRFDGKKKLLLVPLIPMSNALAESNTELFDRYWREVTNQIGNLESVLGTVRHIFHEMLHDDSEDGLEMMKSVSPGSVKLVKYLMGSGSVLCPFEDPEILMEMTDWQRCLSIGLVSKSVQEVASEKFRVLTETRNSKISESISNAMEEDEVGILCISEGHTVQFSADVQVFYVAPPSSNELKTAVTELLTPSEPTPE